MKINKDLAAKAKKLDICKPWYDQLLKAGSKDEMMQMYIKGIDFCLSKDFPSVEYLEQNGKDITDKYGVHVNKTVSKDNAPFTVLLGASRAVLKCTDFNFSQVFVKHQSFVDLTVSGNSITVIDAFDDCVIVGVASENATVLVNRYGNARINIKKKDDAVIKLIEKFQKTY